MAGPGDLHALCLEWLGACSDAVATAAGGAIDRAYVSPGPPAFDCEQLTVHAGGPAEGDTAPLQPPLAAGQREHDRYGAVHLVQLTAVAVRCIPVMEEGGEPPDPADMEAAAEETNGDVWAIWNVTRQLIKDGTLFPSPSGTREVFLEPAFPIDPSGGTGGWQIPIRVQLGGYSAP